MGLKIYNSLTNSIEDFVSVKPNKVTMYVCGPTVYNYIHIGNARPVIFYDILKKYLEFIGYEVIYASNVTDVDDRIINQAIESHRSEEEIAKKYEKAFFEAVKFVGSNKPDYIPHATDYITDMIEFIQKLIAAGYAYEIDGDVYFRINKLDNYGCLSNQVQEDLEQGVRISVSSKKENPLDFALWKKTDVGIKWDSPFGEGRPGWHTECVVMNHKLFGGMIDIHGGGVDLKFPHHENEIAQSEALFHDTLAKYWIHVGRLDFNGEKMSKSLGNVIFVKDLTKHQANVIRMLIAFSPYRSNINYSDELYSQYEKEYEKWQRTYQQAINEIAIAQIKSKDLIISDIDGFVEFMNQDMNVQNVMTLIQQIIKDINQAIRSKEIDLLADKVYTFEKIIDIFGIDLNVIKMTDDEIAIYKDWLVSRANKDFSKADELRKILEEKKILIK